jgi:rubrerythrin
MHQARELDIKTGHDSSKELNLVFHLRQVRERHHHEAHINATKGDNYMLGMETVLDQLLAKLEHRNGWYCVRCGHLDAEEVTNNEQCAVCGAKL